MNLSIPQLNMGQKILSKHVGFYIANTDRVYGFLPVCSLDMLMN